MTPVISLSLSLSLSLWMDGWMNGCFNLCCFGFFVVYSLDSDSSVCAVVSFLDESDGCVLPCTAISTVEFAIPPRVSWARMVSFENRTLVRLDNPFWYHTAGLDFYGYEPDEPCRLDRSKSSDHSYHYDCSTMLNTCKDDVHLLHGVEFRCFIKDEHSGNGLSECVVPHSKSF